MNIFLESIKTTVKRKFKKQHYRKLRVKIDKICKRFYKVQRFKRYFQIEIKFL